MNSITECLTRIIGLTEKNLSILKTLNEAFFTKRSHLTAVVNDETYVIPSFISLENRIETLEHNLENIVNAPLTGEAFTYYDGTTQKLELSGYSTTPNKVTLPKPDQFKAEVNHIFKDFMNPNPFVRLEVEDIPNNIKHVNILKVVILNEVLRSLIANMSTNGSISYANLMKALYTYREDIDFEMYSTLKRLPMREGYAQGSYNIVRIIDNYQDSNLDEFYELELDSDLVYYINNDTIQRDIRVGDYLVTHNDKVMLKVVELNPILRSMKVKVEYGAYSDLQDISSNNINLYNIKFYCVESDMDLHPFSNTKYIDVPLEENRYIVIFAAPVNDTTNIQAPWGMGQYLDVDQLTITDPEDPSNLITFRTYYDRYVNNVGDALMSLTEMMNDDEQVSRLTMEQFESLRTFKPTFTSNLIKVSQINKHLNDTQSVKKIRNLYSQKTQYVSELDTIQQNIDQINVDLSAISYDDNNNTRKSLEKQLSDYNIKKAELVGDITKIIQEISITANSSETPIENAKYRIRGFIDLGTVTGLPEFVKPIKIDVQYRYRNDSRFIGDAETFSNSTKNYIFSDWNEMPSNYRKRRVQLSDTGRYTYYWEDLNDELNEPSFNQLDIPITQGEKVDIRYRLVFNSGYPFIYTTSDWSEIMTMEFPEEFTQNIEILDIIEENNNDIQRKVFENLLEEKGLISHVSDELQDQNLLYRHNAEHITSGFLTSERRIIPLSDKLKSMDNDILNLMSEVYGADSSNLFVTLSTNKNSIQLKPYIVNNLHVDSYKTAITEDHKFIYCETDENSDDAVEDPIFAVVQMNLNIRNMGSYDMKIHSLFPGDYHKHINEYTVSKYNIEDYAIQGIHAPNDESNELYNAGVWMMLDRVVTDNSDSDESQKCELQLQNQSIYFRTRIDGNEIYEDKTTAEYSIPKTDKIDPVTHLPKNLLSANNWNVLEATDDLTLKDKLINAPAGSRVGFLYPYPGTSDNICIESDSSFLVLGPGESIDIPIIFDYWFKEATTNSIAVDLAAISDDVLNDDQADEAIRALRALKQIIIDNSEEPVNFNDIQKNIDMINSAANDIPEAKINLKSIKKLFNTVTDMSKLTVSRAMSFDIRTSLFQDPVTYTFVVDAAYEDVRSTKIRQNNFSKSGDFAKLVTKVPQVDRQKMVSQDVKIKAKNKKNK